MGFPGKRFVLILTCISLLAAAAVAQPAHTDALTPAQQALEFPTVL
jgi:hypothetical protein